MFADWEPYHWRSLTRLLLTEIEDATNSKGKPLLPHSSSTDATKSEEKSPSSPSSDRIDMNTLVPCVFHLHDGQLSLYGNLAQYSPRSIYLLLFNLDYSVNENISDCDLVEDNRPFMPLTSKY